MPSYTPLRDTTTYSWRDLNHRRSLSASLEALVSAAKSHRQLGRHQREGRLPKRTYRALSSSGGRQEWP